MRCPYCQAEVFENEKFCQNCGAEVIVETKSVETIGTIQRQNINSNTSNNYNNNNTNRRTKKSTASTFILVVIIAIIIFFVKRFS